MRGGIVVAVIWAGVALLGRAAGAEDGRDAGPATQPAFSEKEKNAFDGMYKERMARARSQQAKLALAKEMCAGAEGSEGGLKYLLLVAAKDLAAAAGDLEMAVGAMEQVVAAERGERKALLGELLVLQAKRFDDVLAEGRKARDKAPYRKMATELGDRITDNALALGAMYRAERDFRAAEKAETMALEPASRIASPKLRQLRQGILVSRTLRQALDRAEAHVHAGRPQSAVWEYLDAGLPEEAARLKPEPADETAALLVRVATGAEAQPQDILAAAKAWDERSLKARGTLAQIRLMRAAELYEQYMAIGDDLNRTVAKVRLKAIQEKLGDLLAALRKPAEWVYLVDVEQESAQVGFGSFQKFPVAKGPIGIAGKQFPTGLLAHAPSRVVYSLRGRYRQFSTCYGLQTGAGGAASFHVICDGKTVFSSPGMWKNHTRGVAQPLVLDIVGVEKLELVTKAVAIAGAFSCWGDPKVR